MKSEDQFLDFKNRFEAQATAEATVLKDLKTSVRITTLEKRRVKFDHFLTRLFAEYNVKPGTIRKQLDNRWKLAMEETLASRKLFKYAKILGPLNLILVGAIESRVIWSTYIEKINVVIRLMWNENKVNEYENLDE